MIADHYHQPERFRADDTYPNIKSINIEKDSPHFNADKFIAELRSYILDDATHYRTNRLMIPWGDDFFWADAALSYKNLEDIIAYWNSQYSDITLL